MGSKLLTNYFPEFSAILLGRSRPAMVTVNLTDRCNQKCIYCEIGRQPSSKAIEPLRFEDLTWLIDQMAINKIPKISLCGGEPFLFDGIINLVAYARKKEIRCTITTNGMDVFKLSETELNILKECNTEINISIDSFQDKIESFTRGTPMALDNALKSVHKLNTYGIPVTVLCAISRYNFHDLLNFVTEACDKGIKQVLFQPIIYFSNYPDQDVIDNKSQLNVPVDKLDILMGELSEILKFEKRNNIKTNVYRILPWIRYYLISVANHNGKWFFDEVLDKFYCREIYAIIDISYDGGIQPCGLSIAKINIHKNRQLGLIELWSQATQEIKDDLENSRYHPYCNACCHHFSRNMLASIMKYPFQNRVALANMLLLSISRVQSRLYKKMRKLEK